MKKMITMLSTLTITTTIVPTIVACGKEEKIKLDLNSLTSDSFNQLDTIISSGKGSLFAGPDTIETKNIGDINDDQELEKAIKDHIKVMTLKKVFGLNDFQSQSEDDLDKFAAFRAFWGLDPTFSKNTLLNVNVTIVKSNKEYEVTIAKEKWENIKNKLGSNKIKPYYDSIKTEQVKITITK